MSISLEDYSWLVSEAAGKWLSEAGSTQQDLVGLTRLLRKDLSQSRAHLVLQQVELRRRARAKFAQADRMFFTPTSLEQSTDEPIAKYKSGKFPRDHAVADLCCGIGGDLLALGGRTATTGVDAGAEVALLAAENCRRLGLSTTSVRCGEATEFPLESVGAWHIDPDRRPDGSRTSQLAFGSPDGEAIARMLSRQETAAIKLAPAATWPQEWDVANTFEWIQSRGECRQQVAWLGEFADHRRVIATVVDADGVAASFDGDTATASVVASRVGRFCYEPAAAVIAAHLTDALAAHCDCQRVAHQIAYLTSDNEVHHPLLSAFEVLDCLPFDHKQLRGYFRQHGIGHLEVKKRGVPCNPAQLQKQLAAKHGEAAATLIISPQGTSTMALVAKRLTSTR